MIYDTNNQEILSAGFALTSRGEKEFPIKIDCKINEFLRANLSTVTVEAKKDGESYVNLQTSWIDLGDYAGLSQPVSFTVRTTAPEITVYDREDIRIAVGQRKAPEGVLGFTATAQDNSSILVTWFAPTDPTNVTGYQIRVNVPSMGVSNQLSNIGYNFETLQVGLNPDTEAFFEIRAYNLMNDYSVWSEIISATTDA